MQHPIAFAQCLKFPVPAGPLLGELGDARRPSWYERSGDLRGYIENNKHRATR
jgi:hypothetical protein